MKKWFDEIKNVMKVAGQVTAKTVDDLSKNAEAYSKVSKSKSAMNNLLMEIGELYYKQTDNPPEEMKELFEKIKSEQSIIDKYTELIQNSKDAVKNEEKEEEIFEEVIDENVDEDIEDSVEEPDDIFVNLEGEESPWRNQNDE